ncbi:MAG: hypothetical protein AAF798_17985 [Bacteroidota bacterium]
MNNGIIQFFIPAKGYGYVRVPETREEFHFTSKALVEVVEKGMPVTFDIMEDRHGLHATNIRVIPKE